MSESIFIFQDNETEMAVAVRDCDDERAMSMLYAALTSPMSLPIRKFDALEFATCFVAVNKRGPYDILFCGEFMEEDLEDVFLDTIFLAVAIDKFKDRLNKIMEEPC